MNVRASPLKPPAGSLEQPVANCSSSDFSSLVRERTTDQNHPFKIADASPLKTVFLFCSFYFILFIFSQHGIYIYICMQQNETSEQQLVRTAVHHHTCTARWNLLLGVRPVCGREYFCLRTGPVYGKLDICVSGQRKSTHEYVLLRQTNCRAESPTGRANRLWKPLEYQCQYISVPKKSVRMRKNNNNGSKVCRCSTGT